MLASYLIIAAVLALVSGHLALVHRMFMRPETRESLASAQAGGKKDLPLIAVAAQPPPPRHGHMAPSIQ